MLKILDSKNKNMISLENKAKSICFQYGLLNTPSDKKILYEENAGAYLMMESSSND